MKGKQNAPTWRRPGFTLIELLVVISIIGVLTALAASGVFKYLEVQSQNNTANTIRTVSEALRQHWAKVVADAGKEAPAPAVLNLAGGDPHRAQVIWIKLRLIEAFPMSYQEVLSFQSNYGAYIPTSMQQYVTGYQKTLGTSKWQQANPLAQSSALLLMALQVKRSCVSHTLDSLGPNVKDTDGDGNPEIVDSWGTPLAFFRFPTANTDLNTMPSPYISNPSAKFQDLLDPDGTLVSPSWNIPSNQGSVIFQRVVHAINPVNGYPDKRAITEAYMVPVIVSAGRDMQFGWNLVGGLPKPDMSLAPVAPGTPNYEADNIYSYRLRVGQQGN